MTLALNSGITSKLEAIAAHRIGPQAEETAPLVVSNDEATELIEGLKAERIAGAGVVCLIDGGMDVSNETADRIVALHDDVMSQTMRTEVMAVRVSDLLTGLGVDHRLLKGAALAHTVYSDPAERSFRDVDLLVGSSDIDRAVAALAKEGATRAQPELRPGYDSRFAKSVTMRLDGIEIDLHRVLCPGPFGVWMKPGDLFVLRSVVAIADVDVPILDPTDNLLHACYHVALGQVEPALSNLRDVALLAGTSSTLGFDAGRFDQSVDRWRGRPVIRRAIRLVERRLRCSLPAELSWYRTASVDAAEIQALEPYLVEEEGRFAALAPATFRALPMSDRPAYALAVGLPEGAEPLDRIKDLLKRR